MSPWEMSYKRTALWHTFGFTISGCEPIAPTSNSARGCHWLIQSRARIALTSLSSEGGDASQSRFKSLEVSSFPSVRATLSAIEKLARARLFSWESLRNIVRKPKLPAATQQKIALKKILN